LDAGTSEFHTSGLENDANVKRLLMKSNWRNVVVLADDELRSLTLAVCVLREWRPAEGGADLWLVATNQSHNADALRALARTARQELPDLSIWCVELAGQHEESISLKEVIEAVQHSEVNAKY